MVTLPGNVFGASNLDRASPEVHGSWRMGALAIGGGVALGLLLLLFIVPFAAPQDPHTQNIKDRHSGPSAANWLGTDLLGRDGFSRVLHAGRTTALIGLSMGLLAVLMGLPMALARIKLDRVGTPALVYGIAC